METWHEIILERLNGLIERNPHLEKAIAEKVNSVFHDKRELARFTSFLEELEQCSNGGDAH
jgi:hypothetical protein